MTSPIRRHKSQGPGPQQARIIDYTGHFSQVFQISRFLPARWQRQTTNRRLSAFSISAWFETDCHNLVGSPLSQFLSLQAPCRLFQTTHSSKTHSLNRRSAIEISIKYGAVSRCRLCRSFGLQKAYLLYAQARFTAELFLLLFVRVCLSQLSA